MVLNSMSWEQLQVKVENVQKPHQVFVWKQQQLHAEVITGTQ